MNDKTIMLALDTYDQRIHEGALRYFANTAPETRLLKTRAMPWEKTYTNPDKSAIILARWKHNMRSLSRDLHKLHTPFVLLCGELIHKQCAQVLEDNYAAGQIAAQYFLQRQFRRFAVAGQGVEEGYAERLRGFEEMLATQGYAALRIIYSHHVRDSSSRSQALAWGPYVIQQLSQAEKPLAILALDDQMGESVLRHCKAASIKVPEEVAVLGVGNDHLECDFAMPPLSSIDMNYEEIGWQAARLMHSLLNGDAPPSKPIVVAPRGVVERRSTEILSAEDPRAMLALRQLMDNIRAPLTTTKLARSVGLSVAQLNRLFVKFFGRTVKKELIHLRIQLAQKLLATTESPGNIIASETGFRTQAHMCRIFRQETGVTMKEFRASVSGRAADITWVPQTHTTRNRDE